MDVQSIQSAFCAIDADNSGFLEREEIRSLMAQANVDISDDELEVMIRRADANGDGKIDIQEFKKLLANF
ncbi:MAG: EF-hand domain-containing protein [Flavobacteriaceae bacterium]